MNEYYMNVNFAKGTIDTDLNKLVQNDYNSSKIKFTFDKEGTIQFKMLFPNLTTAYIDEIQNNEIILSEGLLSQNGIYKIEICINGTNDRLTDYATHEFIVRKELIDTDPIVEPDDRVPILDRLINEVNNIDIDAEKVDDTTTIRLNKKDGTQKTIEINDGTDGIDGIGLNYNWVSTSLGIKREDEQEYQYVNLKGDKGDAGAIKMVIVNELPATGSDDTIYLVPNDDPETGNNYDEYVYVNNAWEKLGGIQVEVDLTDYVKNTDYATSSKGGVIKTGTDVGTDVTSGKLFSNVVSYTNYTQYLSNYGFISKGTLENVITGKGLVSNTDYASVNTGGVVKINGSVGTGINASGLLYALNSAYSTYTNASGTYFISKGTLENVITGKGLVSNTDYATDSTGGVIKTLDDYGTYMINGVLSAKVKTYAQYQSLPNQLFISKGTLENVLNARIGDIDSVLDTINGEVI